MPEDSRRRTTVSQRKSRRSAVSRRASEKKNFRQRMEDMKSKMTKQQFMNFCKSFSHFLFSTVGLCLLVLLYSITGGALFTMMEADNESLNLKKAQINARNYREETLKKLALMSRQIDCHHDLDNWTSLAQDMLKEFQRKTHYITSEEMWDGTYPGAEIKPQWELINALLYATTIITTIGYGHIYPRTVTGMLFTIIYSIIGVPLALLYLANMGSFMADLFRYVYHRLCCDACCPEKCFGEKHESEHDISPDVVASKTIAEDKSATEHAANNRHSKTVIQKQSVPENTIPIIQTTGEVNENNVNNNAGVVSGSASLIQHNVETSSDDNDLSKPNNASSFGLHAALERSAAVITHKAENNNITPQGNRNSANGDDLKNMNNNADSENVDDDDEYESPRMRLSLTELKEQYVEWKSKYRYMSVPISLTLLVMLSYLFIGAVLFSIWESWTFVQALYFSFITLTTIGLGDLVPGLQDAENVAKPIFSAVYLLVGLALIAMCMDLMQAEVRTRVITVAQKVGIIQKPEDKLKKTDAEAVFAAIQG